MQTMRVKVTSIVLCLASSAFAFYQSSDVIELNEGEFNKQVLKGEEVWLVEFYAPWCGHCKNLIPDMKKVATQLKGVVNVGAVDGTRNEKVMQKYQVQSFPTIKIFGFDKTRPQDYNGERTATAMVSESMKAVSRMVKNRSKNPSSSSKSGSSSSEFKPSDSQHSYGGGSDVVTLNDANFNALVIESNEQWLVKFYAPWGGHCKKLAPEWETAATRLKGSGVNLGAVDATVETGLASKYGVKGYPSIKIFLAGKKSKAKDYQGRREAGEIVDYSLQMIAESGVPPSIPQLAEGVAVFE